jgi:mannose-6-phosphate isomerase-like protein (cupin superfamily)
LAGEALMDFVRSATLHVTPAQGRKLPNDDGHPSARAMAHGAMEVRWFQPNDGRQHTPHDRDELYFIVSGTATFHRGVESGPFEENKLALLGEEQIAVAPGDVIFVPAGAEHFFDELSPGFAVWAIFYGPEGGEPP